MRKVFGTIMLVCIFIVTACGGNRPSTKLKVDMVEFIFTPAEFVIPAGQEITITAVNNGAVIHEFVIMNFGQTIGDDFGDEDEGNIYWEVEAEPGKTVTATFTAPTEPGEYQVVCGTEGHFIAGMVGKLTVVSP
jgi:uncharacterized cupredoxin-like copper-binding protein